MSGETEDNVSGWTTDTLREYMQKQHEDLKALLTERYETQNKAVDKAFEVQETAMQAALLSAEKAVIRADAASEKRFDSVNEFRQTLTDQNATFATRNESEAKHLTLQASIDRTTADVRELELRITSRLDDMRGRTTGADRVTDVKRGETMQVVAIVSVLLVALSIAVTLIIAFRP